MGQFELENVNFFSLTNFFVKLISPKFFVKLKDWSIIFLAVFKIQNGYCTTTETALVCPSKVCTSYLLHRSNNAIYVLRIYQCHRKILFRKISTTPIITKKSKKSRQKSHYENIQEGNIPPMYKNSRKISWFLLHPFKNNTFYT